MDIRIRVGKLLQRAIQPQHPEHSCNGAQGHARAPQLQCGEGARLMPADCAKRSAESPRRNRAKRIRCPKA